jgi:hypothetical protein
MGKRLGIHVAHTGVVVLVLTTSVLALYPAGAKAAPPTCSSPKVGVPHNTRVPIFLHRSRWPCDALDHGPARPWHDFQR